MNAAMPIPSKRDRAGHHHQRQLQRRFVAALGGRRLRGLGGRSRRLGTLEHGDAGVGRERRRQPRGERVVAAERVRHANVARQHRPERQDDEREGHGRRGIVQAPARAMSVPCIVPVRTRVMVVRAGTVSVPAPVPLPPDVLAAPRDAAPRGT